MGKKLTNEDIDLRLIGRNIKRLNDTAGITVKSDWECLICQFIWKAKAADIFHLNSGCPKCAGNARLTNEIVDRRLIESNRDLIRLSDINGADEPCDWKCLICQYIWITTPHSILSKRKSGCPKCSGLMKLTNEEVDLRLISRNIIRLDDIVNSITKRRWKCSLNECGHIWNSTPDRVLNANRGCPKCSNRIRLTNEIVDRKLQNQNRTIIRTGNVLSSLKNCDWQCLICQFIWQATPNSVVNKNTGCPKCIGHTKLTNEIVDERLLKQCRQIRRINDVIDGSTEIDWECLNCGYIWQSSPINIVTIGSGCRKCSQGKNEKLVGSVLEKHFHNIERQKCIRDFDLNEPKRYLMDYYIPEIAAIEYNGRQHYEPVCFGGCSLEQA